MNSGWADALNGLGVVGLCLLFVIALTRGWIVIGKTHNDVVARYEKGRDKDAETILILSRAVTEQKATETATARILASIREIAASTGGGP